MPLISTTGMSVREPASEAGLLWVPLLWSSWRCSSGVGLVGQGLSGLCLVSNGLGDLDTSLKEPEMQDRRDSVLSASSLAKDRQLRKGEEECCNKFKTLTGHWHLVRG